MASGEDELPPHGPLPSALQSAVPPSVPIEAYTRRVLRCCDCSPLCLVMSFAYMRRVGAGHAGLRLGPLTAHRLLITGTVVAAKFMDDGWLSNRDYAAVGGVPLRELNAMELELLALLGWRVRVPPAELVAAIQVGLFMCRGWHYSVMLQSSNCTLNLKAHMAVTLAGDLWAGSAGREAQACIARPCRRRPPPTTLRQRSGGGEPLRSFQQRGGGGMSVCTYNVCHVLQCICLHRSFSKKLVALTAILLSANERRAQAAAVPCSAAKTRSMVLARRMTSCRMLRAAGASAASRASASRDRQSSWQEGLEHSARVPCGRPNTKSVAPETQPGPSSKDRTRTRPPGLPPAPAPEAAAAESSRPVAWSWYASTRSKPCSMTKSVSAGSSSCQSTSRQTASRGVR